jgi:hypothetical protein
LFCSKASFVRIAAAVSISIVCLFYRNEYAQKVESGLYHSFVYAVLIYGSGRFSIGGNAGYVGIR